jgi:hypothetical protein
MNVASVIDEKPVGRTPVHQLDHPRPRGAGRKHRRQLQSRHSIFESELKPADIRNSDIDSTHVVDGVIHLHRATLLLYQGPRIA